MPTDTGEIAYATFTSTGDPAARRAELLTAYCDRLLAGSKERPSPAALGAYRRLVASISAEEFEAKVGNRRLGKE